MRRASQVAPVLCMQYNCTFGRVVFNHMQLHDCVEYPLQLRGSGVRKSVCVCGGGWAGGKTCDPSGLKSLVDSFGPRSEHVTLVVTVCPELVVFGAFEILCSELIYGH